MYHLNSDDEWNCIHSQDLWVYNKLNLSRVLGYTCGPIGTSVPKPDFYIIRPCMNLLGMGRSARKEFIDKYTDTYHPGEFWCEIFEGEHLSVDFQNKEPKLTVKGHRKKDNPLYKWDKWEIVDRSIQFPEVLNSLQGDYEWINCEFIGNKLIEVHFRRNPDFRYNNTVAIPVWDESEPLNSNSLRYIVDEDYLRKGFFIDFSG